MGPDINRTIYINDERAKELWCYPKDHRVDYEVNEEESGSRYRWGVSDRDPNATKNKGGTGPESRRTK